MGEGDTEKTISVLLGRKAPRSEYLVGDSDKLLMYRSCVLPG